MNESGPTFRQDGSPGGFILWCWLALLALPALGLPAPGLRAQSIVSGEVEGRVLDEAGRPIRGAAAALTEARSGTEWTRRTRTDGVFTFRSVPGGSYELRVEALGYRPLVVVGLSVTPGERAGVPVRLVAEVPPLTRVDTLRYGAGGGVTPGLGRRMPWQEISALPDRIRDVAGLLALSSEADMQGGLEGLPARFTTVFADGQAYRPARHPALPGAGSPTGHLFPRIGLQSATVRTALEDIEWSGAPGGIVALETRPPRARASGELYGFWSGGPTWTNEVVGEGPALLSAWGGGSASLPVAQDASPLSVSFEGALVETPNLFWRNDYFADRVESEPQPPGIRTTGYGAGLARGGWKVGDSGQLTVRAGASAFRNESDRRGVPQAVYGTELPGEGVDGSLAAVASFPVGERTTLEIRGSGSMSSRTWESTSDGGRPGGFLVRNRALLGTNPSFPASADRMDLSVTPVVHFRTGSNRLKGGARLEYAGHDMTHVEEQAGAFYFGSRRGLQAGQGAAVTLDGSAPSESFSVTRATLFGQYRWTAFQGLDLTTGLSYTVETLPMGDVDPAEEWAALTGVANVTPDNTLSAFDGHVHLRWDLRGDGRSWLLGGMGVEHGTFDPAAMHEVLTLDGAVDVRRSLGQGLDWESGGTGTATSVTGTRLALLGPDMEPPRTARGSAALYHTLAGGVRLGVSGTFRRTESILRRTDLNRLLVPTGTDQDGRPVFGDLRIVAGVLAADPGSSRRFPGFESVWALNADGWSEYLGVTASLDAPLWKDGFLALRYTRSETTDNWVGASQGGAFSRVVPELPVEEWDEAPSDFDVPHRLSALAVLPLPLPWDGAVSALYTLRSARPFTPRVASGLDANGDGSFVNDVAFVPESGTVLDELAAQWECLSRDRGGFAQRNGCRADPVHSLDVRLSVGLPRVGGVASALVVDGLNLTDTDMGVRDDNLLLLGSGNVTSTAQGVEVPYTVNPGFGNWVFRSDTGRMIRVGIRIGGGGGGR